MKYKNTIILSLLILGLVLAALYSILIRPVQDMAIEGITKSYTVSFDEINRKVYFRARVWGVAGNHEEIILSSSTLGKDFVFSKEKDYVFYTSEIYFKRRGEDSLIVFAKYSSIPNIQPTNFSDKLKIEVIALKDAKVIEDYEVNYTKYGLTKVSSY